MRRKSLRDIFTGVTPDGGWEVFAEVGRLPSSRSRSLELRTSLDLKTFKDRNH